MMIVPAEVEVDVILSILLDLGVPDDEARIQAQSLVEADLRGHPSHGLQRFPMIVERIRAGLAIPRASVHTTWRSDVVLEVDGGRGLGPVIAFHVLELLSSRTRETGVTVAAIRNNNHLGILALYVEEFTHRSQIGIALTTSEALVHPWSGSRAMLGTNPIAVGIPADPFPFLLDMATGIVSMGQVLEYGHRGDPIPSGWALDSEGNPTTDATAAAQGSLAPFGGAKGYGLGLAIELLVSSLTLSAIGPEVKGTLDAIYPCNKGDLLICLDPVVFGLPQFTQQLGRYLNDVRQSPALGHSEGVFIPGDRSRALRSRRLIEGIPIADRVWHQIEDMRGLRTTASARV